MTIRYYDCFMLFNELDLLELRLETLYDVVDHFVLVEAAHTHSGKPKPFYYAENRRRFARFADKIRLVTLTNFGAVIDALGREIYSRERVVDGLCDADPQDVVFLSDVDEIWNPNKRDAGDLDELTMYRQHMSYYYLNARDGHWHGTRRIRRGRWPGAQKLRTTEGISVEDGGWHFSYLGGAEQIVEKIRAFHHHADLDTPKWTNLDRIRRVMANGEDLYGRGGRFTRVAVDESFPRCVRENPEKWAHLVGA